MYRIIDPKLLGQIVSILEQLLFYEYHQKQFF